MKLIVTLECDVLEIYHIDVISNIRDVAEKFGTLMKISSEFVVD